MYEIWARNELEHRMKFGCLSNFGYCFWETARGNFAHPLFKYTFADIDQLNARREWLETIKGCDSPLPEFTKASNNVIERTSSFIRKWLGGG